jgi:hypothetical protein
MHGLQGHSDRFGGSAFGTGNFMKNVLLLAAAGVAALTTSFAALADSEGAFVQASAGRSSTSDRDSNAFGLLGGYRWAVDKPFYLGLEGGYVSLGRDHASTDYSIAFTDITGPHTLTGSTRGTIKNEALLIGVNGKWELPAQYFITAHAGIARYRNNQHLHYAGNLDGAATEGGSDRYSYYDTNYYAGLGFGYDFSRQVSLTFTYDHYAPGYEAYGVKEKIKFDAYAAAVEFRF